MDLASMYGRKSVVEFLVYHIDDPFKMSVFHTDLQGSSVLDKTIRNGHLNLFSHFITDFVWEPNQVSQALKTCQQIIEQLQHKTVVPTIISDYKAAEERLNLILSQPLAEPSDSFTIAKP